jgi:hypothetical protein
MYLKTSLTYVNNMPEPSLSLSFIKEEDCKASKLYRNVRVCTQSSLIKIRKQIVKSSEAPRYATLKY